MLQLYEQEFTQAGKTLSECTEWKPHAAFKRCADYRGWAVEEMSQENLDIQCYVLLPEDKEDVVFLFFLVRNYYMNEAAINFWQEELSAVQLCKPSESVGDSGIFRSVFGLDNSKASASFLVKLYLDTVTMLLERIPSVQTQCLPPLIRHSFIEQMSNVIEETMNRLKILRYKTKSFDYKTSLYFSITNLSDTTEDAWKTFPVYLEASTFILAIRVFFSYNEDYCHFDEEAVEQYLLDYLALCNSKLQLGYFSLISSRRLVQYYVSFPYFLFPELEWVRLVPHYLKLAVVTYKAHAYALARILEAHTNKTDIDLQRVSKICEGRLRRQFEKNTDLQVNISGNQESAHTPQKKSSSHDDDEEDDEDDDEESESSDFDCSSSTMRLTNEKGYDKELEVIAKIKADPIALRYFEFIFEEVPGTKELRYNLPEANSLEDAVLSNAIEEAEFDYILDTLLLLHSRGIVFSDFPERYIFFDKAQDPPVRIRPVKLYQLLNQVTKISAEDYKQRMLYYQCEFLLNIKKESPTLISTADFIGQEAFKQANITHKQLLLGSGGFGEIYKNELYGQAVAVKIPKEAKETSEKGKKRIQREYEIMKQLPHAHIIKCYGLVQHNHKVGLVMELCQSESLNEYCKAQRRNKSFRMKEALTYLYQIVTALEFMHLKKICHLDIKPHNIFLNNEKQALLGDFGLSKHVDLSRKNLSTGYTLMYCSPEQFKGESHYFEADVWSFGMTLYAVAVGCSPYQYLVKKGEKLEKKQYYYEIKNNRRQPEISEDFEMDNPLLTHLMRSTWADVGARPTMKEVRQTLKRVLDTQA